MAAILDGGRGHRTQFWKYTTQGPSMPWQWPFWTEIRVTEHNFGSWPTKDHQWHVCYIGLLVSEEKILKHFFPIGSYVKTMSVEGGHLGWRSGSSDTILKIDHLRTIHAMFALNWLTGFRGKKVKKNFPYGHRVPC